MTDQSPYALKLTHNVLRFLIVLNVLFGIAILALFVATLYAKVPVMTALGVKMGTLRSDSLVFGMRMIMVIGILAVPIANVVLGRLDAIVGTVSAGDPFVVLNAERLKTIAWSVLALEILNMIVGGIAAAIRAGGQPLDIKWDFSVTPWLAVLLCFVLSRVFEQGTRMRDDLEGVV